MPYGLAREAWSRSSCWLIRTARGVCVCVRVLYGIIRVFHFGNLFFFFFSLFEEIGQQASCRDLIWTVFCSQLWFRFLSGINAKRKMYACMLALHSQIICHQYIICAPIVICSREMQPTGVSASVWLARPPASITINQRDHHLYPSFS